MNPHPRFSWDFRRWEIRQRLDSEGPFNFMRWPIVSEFLYTGDTLAVRQKLDALGIKSPHLLQHITESGRGNPPPFPALPGSSGTLVSQAFYISSCPTDFTTADRVVEFGGGYGAMAVLLARIGFRGAYEIIDLPEVIEIQKYYIGDENIAVSFHESAADIEAGPDWLISFCALSEVDFSLRNAVIEKLRPRNIFMSYQLEYQDFDNHSYIDDLRESYEMGVWTTYSMSIDNHMFAYGKIRSDYKS